MERHRAVVRLSVSAAWRRAGLGRLQDLTVLWRTEAINSQQTMYRAFSLTGPAVQMATTYTEYRPDGNICSLMDCAEQRVGTPSRCRQVEPDAARGTASAVDSGGIVPINECCHKAKICFGSGKEPCAE